MTLFVVVFLGIVFAALTSYHFTVESKAHGWYLFQVAKHTSWVLAKVGYMSTAERTSRGPLVRIQLRQSISEQLLEARERVRILRDDAVIADSGDLDEIKRLKETITSLRNGLAISADISEEQRIRLWRKQLGWVFAFIVVPACGAIEVAAIFVAAVVAFPTQWWKRLLGIVLGIPLLYGVNVLRLACLGLIGARDGGGKWFDFTHEYVWQTVYIIFVVAVWLAWVEYLVKRKA